MEEIIGILMRRDGLTYEEAKQAYLDCKSEIDDAIAGSNACTIDEILACELGLEPDYIFNFI